MSYRFQRIKVNLLGLNNLSNFRKEHILDRKVSGVSWETYQRKPRLNTIVEHDNKLVTYIYKMNNGCSCKQTNRLCHN